MTANNHDYTPENCPYRGDHDLIIRIDERTENIQEAIEGKNGILEHLGRLNGRTRKNEVNIARVMAAASALAVIIPILIKVLWP